MLELTVSNHTCPRLGIQWQASPGLGNSYHLHPIFSTPIKQLIKLACDIDSTRDHKIMAAAGLLSYLPVRWDCHLDLPAASGMLILHLDRLIKVAYKLDQFKRMDDIPNLVISPDTAKLYNLEGWLDTLSEALVSAAKKSSEQARDIRANRFARKEQAIERLIQSAIHKSAKKTGVLIAEWACIACEFPTKPFWYPNGVESTVAEYWKYLIATSSANLHMDLLKARVDVDDLEDLIDFLEFTIPAGTILATHVLTVLRETRDLIGDFRSPQLHQPKKSDEPNRKDYATAMDYIRARLAWQTGSTVVKTANTMSIEI